MSKYQIQYQEDPNPSDEAVLFHGINAESFLVKSMSPIEPFAFFIKDHEGTVLGGIKGIFYYGCLYTDLLWIHEKIRDHDYGTKLMIAAEDLAKKKKCSFATVNTMDWEALPFYQKLGYEIEFTREGYVKDSKLYMLRKDL